MPLFKRRIRFGLKTVMLFTLIVAVGLGMAVAKLRRQNEDRDAIRELLSRGADIQFANRHELQMDPILYSDQWLIEEKGWRHDLVNPYVLRTINSFASPTWWPVGDPNLEKSIAQMTNLNALVFKVAGPRHGGITLESLDAFSG